MTEIDGTQQVGAVLPSVADFFRGKNVFVTGASGFMGRTLVEKLLRDAPDVGRVFVLLRAKKGKAPAERVRHMTDVQLFQRLRKEQPAALDKVVAVAGDAQLPRLGLSADDQAMLREHVHVAFHVAASVRFDDPLRTAVLLNVRGTREVCRLAEGMRNLQALIHVSTAFCNSDKVINEERLQPPPGDWKLFVEAAETLDDHVLRCLTSKLQGGFPNTYVFSKSLAEHVIDDYKNVLPVAIIRPSVVVSSQEQPFCGWMDNLNGPLSIILAVELGVKHSVYVPPGGDLDNIPVDLCINGAVLLAMDRAQSSDNEELKIVNASKYKSRHYILEELISFFRLTEYDYPAPRAYKAFLIVVHWVFLDLLISYVIDLPIALVYKTLAWFTNNKFDMVRVQRKMFLGRKLLNPFVDGNFQFPNKKFLDLEKLVNPVDKGKFNLSVERTMEVPHMYSSGLMIKSQFMAKNKNPKRDAILVLGCVTHTFLERHMG